MKEIVYEQELLLSVLFLATILFSDNLSGQSATMLTVTVKGALFSYHLAANFLMEKQIGSQTEEDIQKMHEQLLEFKMGEWIEEKTMSDTDKASKV